MAGPCLLFPGVSGNEILWSGRFFTSQTGTVWVNLTRLALGGLQWLELNPAGDGPASTWIPYTYPGNEVAYYYPPLMEYLRSRDWTVHTFQTDWRKTIATDAVRAAQEIVRLSVDQPVTLVCHSRGGLLAAAACERLRTLGELDRVKEAVGLGVPWKGSYNAFGYLAGFDRTPLLLTVLGNLASLNATYFLRGRSVREVCCTWPGLYELCVDPVAAAAQGDAGAADWYNAFLWERSKLPLSALHMANAKARWLTNPGPPVGLRWSHIIGTGFRTRGPTISTQPVGLPQGMPENLAGDGSVPEWSAGAAPGTVYRVNLTHNELVTSTIVHGIMEGIFQTP